MVVLCSKQEGNHEKGVGMVIFMERQFPGSLKYLRCDGGKEFIQKAVSNWCTQHGIQLQTSNVNTPEENSLAENAHKIQFANARCEVDSAKAPPRLWCEAAGYSTYVRNMTPMRRLKWKTPHEVLYGIKPSIRHIRPWYSVGFAFIPKTKRTHQKLGARAIKCRLFGISDITKGYRLLDISNNMEFTSRDVK